MSPPKKKRTTDIRNYFATSTQASEEMGNSSELSLDSSKASPKTEVHSDMEEDCDYDCPICQEVLKMPIRTKNCQHVFCQSCFKMAVRNRHLQCPLCRSPVLEGVRRATDIQKRMRQTKGKCRACRKKRVLSKMRLHYRFCKKYIEEFGPTSKVAILLPVQTPNLPESSVVIHSTPVPTPSNR